MKIPKKKLKEIQNASCLSEVIEEKCGEYVNGSSIRSSFLDGPPEGWHKHEQELFDILVAHEQKLIHAILKILNR